MEVKLENIKYKKTLDNINLTFIENQITSIIGKNNSGQTDILNLIYGCNKPNSGKVIIDKEIVNDEYNKKHINIIKKSIFYLMQDFQVQLFNINILEDIKYVIKDFENSKLNELLKMFDLEKTILSKSYLEISSGEKKKILLIIMILSDANIMLLDNPTSCLDYKSIQVLVKLLKRQKRNGKIIIIISNDSNFLLSVSDRIIVLDNKNIIADGDKYSILENSNLLKKVHVMTPNVSNFRNRVLNLKNIKIEHRDNINDLLKDIYRNAR